MSTIRRTEDTVQQWDEQHDHLLSQIESAITAGQPADATTLLARAWTMAPAETPLLCGQLRTYRARLAPALPASRAVADVLRHSAQVCIQQSLYREAEIDGMRELGIWRDLDDYPRAIDALHRLADTFRTHNRLHRVIDCADQTLMWSQRHEDQVGIAAGFRNLGLVMLAANRTADAVRHLSRARDEADTLPDIPATQRAELLAQLGRALWMSGATTRARRRFSDALALLVDVDEAAADRIRTALSTPTDTLLPASALDDMDHVHAATH